MQCLAEYRCFLKDVCQCVKYSLRAWEKRAEKGREGWYPTYSKIESPEWSAVMPKTKARFPSGLCHGNATSAPDQSEWGSEGLEHRLSELPAPEQRGHV